jgi:hypothetical protein
MSYTKHRSLFTRTTNTAARKEAQPMHTSTRLHLGIRALLALLLTLALLPLLTPAPARAAGFMVTTLADSGDGSLREAIELANANVGADTITFTVSGTITLASTLPAINDELTIDGMGQSVIVSGDNAVRVMVVNSGKTLNLNALTIANGRCSNCSGGGIFSDGGTVNVNNSTFSENSAACGPGCGTYGAAIANWQGVLNVSNSTFVGNSASGLGGGISNHFGTVTVSNSTFAGNSARSAGGGIYNDFDSAMTVSNSTFAGNSAGSNGSGILNLSTLTLSNSIIANSTSGRNCDGSLTDGGGNISYPDQTCPGMNADPKLDPNGLQNNGGPTQTIALLPGSAAIDAATSDCPDTDQRGVERPQGSACDIGAFELQVIFPFSGFFQPIDNAPTVNSVKAGSAIPVKFSLGDDQGLNIFEVGYPKVQQVACASGMPTDEVEQTVTAGASGLQYDAASGQYSYTWKTDKKWAGTCRQLILKLIDGSVHSASFQFR